MDHFLYKNNALHAESVNLNELVKQVGSPFYCYSQATFKHHCEVFKQSMSWAKNSQIHFAVKSNSNLEIMRLISSLGFGADVVSEGEIRKALLAGFNPQAIIFSGVGKTSQEIDYALEKKIFQFNVESVAELLNINERAGLMNIKAPIAIRVNPNVDASTHKKITTGLKTSKFGIDISEAKAIYSQAKALSNIDIQGISMHIGSQISSLEPFRNAFIILKKFVKELEDEGINLKVVDLGGGLGIPYFETTDKPPHPEIYGKMVQEIWGDSDVKLCFEPGRVIAGNAGLLVSEVIYTKPAEFREFLIIDAAMNDLIRPSLYDAYHDVIPVNKVENSETVSYDIVGPVCETGDTFAQQRKLQKMQAGDLLAFRSCGAYGAVMANNYNSRQTIPEVLVDGDKYKVIRRRQTYEEMFALEC